MGLVYYLENISALATTDDDMHKSYKIRNMKAFWSLLKVGLKKLKNIKDHY